MCIADKISKMGGCERKCITSVVQFTAKPTLLYHHTVYASRIRVNRHVRKSHPNAMAGQAAPQAKVQLAAGGDEELRHAPSVISTQGGRLELQNSQLACQTCKIQS
jgi:hypothetical protein